MGVQAVTQLEAPTPTAPITWRAERMARLLMPGHRQSGAASASEARETHDTPSLSVTAWPIHANMIVLRVMM